MQDRWNLCGNGISWQVKENGGPHSDDLEMSGRGISYVVKYGVSEDRSLYLERYGVWPSLRRVPNDTSGSFQCGIPADRLPSFSIGEKPVSEYPEEFTIDDFITIHSRTDSPVEITRQCFPSTTLKNAYEIILLTNPTDSDIRASLSGNPGIVSFGRGCKGVYLVETSWEPADSCILIPAGGMSRIKVSITATIANQKRELIDADIELENREKRVEELTAPLVLETDDPILDAMFRFAKIRAGESIFDTMAGPLHSPGGYSYYAATWCNDEIEYAGPWFAFTGDKLLIEASVNAYQQYRPFMGPEYLHIPSSIISEGNDFWEGAGDRGDAAMYAYGASLFVLTAGTGWKDPTDPTDPAGQTGLAATLWDGIEWCLEYCRRKLNDRGVVLSDSDELEERFPSGDANLSTSCLYYGGLIYGAKVALALGKEQNAKTYREQAQTLRAAIQQYFGGQMHGFRTYRYYDGNQELRSWICLPLCLGINERKEGTIDALLSDYLWTKDGLVTCENTQTVWDRSTLYGLKGGFISGYGDRVIGYLKEYSRNRLLGERVPYAFEAYPEGGKRHLSGESALYCRTVVEGLFGIAPEGMDCFTITPRLPKNIKYMKLRNIMAFGDNPFDIEINPDGAKVMRAGQTIWQGKMGEKAVVRLR